MVVKPENAEETEREREREMAARIKAPTFLLLLPTFSQDLITKFTKANLCGANICLGAGSSTNGIAVVVVLLQ